MTASISRQHLLLLAVVAAAAVIVVLGSASTADAGVDDPPLPSVAFLARADNPVDALAAAPMAGQLGAPVLLTFPDQLHPDAAAALVASDPDVVVLAGGEVALSPDVQSQVAALLPDADVIRRSGSTRTSTAAALAALPSELGFTRPLLTGAAVPGDAAITGEMTVGGTDVAATLAALTARVDTLEGDLAAAADHVDALEAQLATADARVGELEATLAGVSRTTVDGRDTLRFEAMNLQVVNGTGTTDGTPNGLGNVVIGYNAPRFSGTSPADRGGSHNLVIGDENHWLGFAGVVAGYQNTLAGEFTSVIGGLGNTASGAFATVTGGTGNLASGAIASIAGGGKNEASGLGSSITGGFNSGAIAAYTSVAGGFSNVASGLYGSVAGGASNTAAGAYTAVAGGHVGTVADDYDARIGDSDFPDS